MSKVRQIVIVALLGALAFMIMLLIGLPILPGASFLKYEPSGVVILAAAFLLGPVGGAAACVVKDLLFLLLGAGNIFGVSSDFINTSVFAITAALLLRKSATLSHNIGAYTVAAIISTAVMIPANLIILPLEFGMTIESVLNMMLPAILPFNLLKAALNSIIFQILRKRLVVPSLKYFK